MKTKTAFLITALVTVVIGQSALAQPVCAEPVDVVESHWGVCWKWIFPYPCKKSSTVKKYRYDFLPWRTRFSWVPFRCSYEGCCGARLYSWSHGCWWGSGNGAWNEFSARTEFFDSVQSPVGDCPFTPPPILRKEK